MSIKSDIGTYSLIAGIGTLGLVGQATAQTQTKGPPPVFGKAAAKQTSSQVDKKPVVKPKEAPKASANKTGKKKAKTPEVFAPKAPELKIRMLKEDPNLWIVNLPDYTAKADSPKPNPFAKTTPIPQKTIDNYLFTHINFGNNPRYFQIGVDGKISFNGSKSHINPYFMWAPKSEREFVNGGIDFKLSKLLLGYDISQRFEETTNNSNSIRITSSLTPRSNGSELRNATQTDNEDQKVNLGNRGIAYTFGYSNKGWRFGWQQANNFEETTDTTTIRSQFNENFSSTTDEVQEGGIRVINSTNLQNIINTTTGVNVNTTQVDNQYRLFFDFWKLAFDLNLRSVGSTSNVRTGTSSDGMVTGNTQVIIENGVTADTMDYLVNVHTQSTQNSNTDFRSRQRSAFLNASYQNLEKSGIEANIAIPLRSGPGENIGFGMSYKDFDGNWIGYALFNNKGGRYNSDFILVGGNEKTRKALISHWEDIHNLNRSVFETSQREAIIKDESLENIYRALNGMAFDAKLEKTSGDGANFGLGIAAGNNGFYGRIGHETVSRKTQLKFGVPIGKKNQLNVDCNYNAKDHNYRCGISCKRRM